MTSIKVINTLIVLILLYGCGGSGEKAASTIPISLNTKPTANAGDAQNAETGVVVSLGGEKSIDNEGDALTYQWSLVTVPAGSSVELGEFTTLSTSFSPDIVGTYEAQLIVNDGELSSEPSRVSIIVTKGNEAPTAIAGIDIESYVNMTEFLDGGASFAPENLELTYKWSIIKSPENSYATIDNADSKNSQFDSSVDGVYILQLIVTDENGVSSQDDINITLNKLGQKDVTLLTHELVDNKAKWESQNINNYQMEQLLSGCCGGLNSVPVAMQIQEEDKTLLYYNPNIDWSGELIIDRPMIVPNNKESSFKSIKELFDYIETAITGADEVTVSYHPELGYPQNVIIDWDVSSLHDESGFTIANLINLSGANCDDIEKGYPSIKLNIVDENTAEPINCDVLVEWENEEEESQQVINEEFLYIEAFNIIDDIIHCHDNSPFLVVDETGLISLTIAKAGYSTKTVEYNISGGESCGLIPTSIEVKLEPVN